ncbi:MAG: hypothetical protein LBN39_08540, partial [Planctomycetaceae bacterium]|nr:hypothetical protein [Planctomycetaceae bacterium]
MKPSLIPPIIRYSLSILPFLFAIHFLSAQETEQQLPEVPFSSWRAERFCKAAVKDNILNVNAVNGAPVLSRFCNEIGGQFRITAEIRTLTESSVQLYWTAKGSPRRDDEKRIMVPVQADNQWHRYEFLFSIPDTLTSLAFQFLSAEGTWEVKSITVFCERPQPLIVRNAVPKTVKNEDGSEQAVMIFTVANNVPYPVSFRVNDGTETFFVEEKKTKEIEVPLYSDEVLDSAILTLRPAGFTDIVHPVFRYRSFRPGFPDGAGEWKTFNNVDVDTKGRMM